MSVRKVSVKDYIANYRSTVIRFEDRHRTTLKPVNTQVYDICIAVPNTKIVELGTLDPDADGEPVCDKTDAEGCTRMDQMQCLYDFSFEEDPPEVAARLVSQATDGLVEHFREISLEMGEKQAK